MHNYKEALFYKALEDNKVQCLLCPWNCLISDGKHGVCGVRQNQEGKLYSLIYGVVSSMALDPIEKKPLSHFHPGSQVLSVGTYGCNMKCGHCQNWHISHKKFEHDLVSDYILPQELIEIARQQQAQGIAWTYNEPTIWFEYALEGAKLAKKAGLYTVFVTNGYINPEPLDMIGPYLDAYRVDVKGFNKELYKKLCKTKDFEPVLLAAQRAKNKWNMHVEIVTNIIPTLNDDDAQLKSIAKWMVEKLGNDTVWHVTRFFPCLEYSHLYPTPIETLKRAQQIGITAGLKHVYLGNV